MVPLRLEFRHGQQKAAAGRADVEVERQRGLEDGDEIDQALAAC